MRLMYIFLALSFFGQEVSGQISRPTKAQLFKIFKSSINQDNKMPYDSWLIPNKDSSFNKSDTLYLYDVSNYFNNGYIGNYYIQAKNCCDFVSWNFYRKNAFTQVKQNRCAGWTKVVTNKDFYTIVLSEQNNQTLLKVFHDKSLVAIFNVIAFEEVNLFKNERTNKKLTLVRQKI